MYIRTVVTSVLLAVLVSGTASAKAVSDRQIVMPVTEMGGHMALTGLNPNRKIYDGDRLQRRRYVSIHRFYDSTM